MLGQRIMPKSWHRIGSLMSEGRLKQSLDEIRARVVAASARLPSHQQYLDDHCPAPQS
jgi:tryptophan halogenase